MDGFEFAASLINSIAWPATVVVVAITFRRPVRRLIRRMANRVGQMTEITAWQVGAKFTEKTIKVNLEIADEVSTINPPIDPIDNAPLRISGESPREIVLTAWLEFEEHLQKALIFAGVPSEGPRSPFWYRRFLPPALESRVRELQRLRNQAVHMREFSITRVAAAEYVEATGLLGAVLRHPATVGDIKRAYVKSLKTES